MFRASSSSFGLETPKTFFARIPNCAIPSMFRFSATPFSLSTARSIFQVSVPCPARARPLERLVRIEEDCNRPFIHQLHRHHRLKNSRRNSNVQFAQCFAKFFIERLRLFRRRCRNKTRTPSSARIAVKRELRDDQRTALHIQQRAIHLPIFVFKNPQVRRFLRKRVRHRRGVLAANAQQNHQPFADFAARFVANLHFRAAHPLHYSSHFSVASALRSAPQAQVSAATSPATAPRCTRKSPAPARPPPDRPIATGRAYLSESDGPSRSSPLPGRTTKPARPLRQTERDRFHPPNAKLARQ